MLNSSEVVILAWDQMDSSQSTPEWKQEDITPCTSPSSFHSVPCNSPPLQQVYDSSYPSSSSSPTYYSLFDECSFNNFNTNIYLDNNDINSINNINNNGGIGVVGAEVYLKEDPLKFEDLLENTNTTNQITFTETKAQVASKLLDDLDHLEHLDQWIKEEPLPFSEWLEEKIVFPTFNSGDTTPQLIQQQPQNQYQFENVTKSNNYYPTKIAPNDCINITPAVGNINTSSVDPTEDTTTQTLLQEFENVFEHHVNNTQLTPPQSPNNTSSSYITMQPVQIIQPDVAKALAVVDELVRCRVEGLVYHQNDDSIQSPLSPSTSESSTTSSITGHDESSLSSSSNDPEWIPETIYQNHEDTPLKHRTQKSKRTKPYDRDVIPEDKKSRKKEQNKNAATRYRQKKKQEIAVVLSEEKGLQDINDQLHSNVNDLSREIKYLKGLMRDLFKAKNLIE